MLCNVAFCSVVFLVAFAPTRGGLLLVACVFVIRSHGPTGERGTPSQRKGKGSLSKMPHMDQRRLSNRLERFDLGVRPSPSSSRAKGDSDLAFTSRPMLDDNGLVDWAAVSRRPTWPPVFFTNLCLSTHRNHWRSNFAAGC